MAKDGAAVMKMDGSTIIAVCKPCNRIKLDDDTANGIFTLCQMQGMSSGDAGDTDALATAIAQGWPLASVCQTHLMRAQC